MRSYENMILRQRKWMFFILAILVLGAGFTPFTRIFFGLILGTVISFYNLWLLHKKVNDLGEAVLRSEKPRGLGTVSRFMAAIFVALIAVKYSEYFNIVAVIGGLMTSYIVMAVDFFINQLIKSDKEGEADGS